MNTYLAFALGCDFPILEALRHALVNLDPNRWLLKAAENGEIETVKLAGVCGADVWEECIHRAERAGHTEIIIYALTKLQTLPDSDKLGNTTITMWDILPYQSEPWDWEGKSGNTTITMRDILLYQSEPWDWNGLSQE